MRAAARGILLATIAGTSGCTLIGAGIGSAVPAYETAPPPSPWASLARGTDVRVVLARSAPLWACRLARPDKCCWLEPTRSVSGKYESTRDGRVWIVRPPDFPGPDAVVVGIDPSSIESFDVRDGSQRGTGAVVGAVVDLVVLTIAAATMDPTFGSTAH